MEVVPQAKRLPPLPLQRHDVEEWSTLDSLTGILERARVQRQHWAATTSNSSHHFGKVIDSRARNLADGSKEQRQQTKQLEVFQANIPGGSVQVIRSQSLTTSSWQAQSTTSKLGGGSSWSARNNSTSDIKNDETEFDNLKLALNPLDISSQKMKASVVRRGSISSRRPPSRPRSIAGSRSDKPGQIMEEDEVADGINRISNNNSNSSTNLSQISRICQHYHQEAKNQPSFQSSMKSSTKSSSAIFKQSYLTNGTDSSTNHDKRRDPIPLSGPVTLSFLLDSKKENSDSENAIKKKPALVHKKSCSSEDLRLSPERDEFKDDDTESNEEWNRSSIVRRSLQFPVQSKSEANDYKSDIKSVNSVLKVAKEIEARKQIVTNSLKNNQWEDVLKNVVINNSNNQRFEKIENTESSGIEDELIIKDNNKVLKKKPTFITVESLKEVRGRLRRLGGSPVSDEIKGEEEDDGIVTELKGDSPVDELEDTPKSVKSYVYGMESLLRTNGNRPTTITGTGSLESRSNNKSSSNGNNRSEEWYNRRKSYGFEQVNSQSTTHGSNLYGDKNKVDSSTDSGICRSSETVANVQFWNKPLSTNHEGNNMKTSHMITIKNVQDKSDTNNETPNKQDTFNTDLTQKGRKTVVTLGVTTKNSVWNWSNQNDKTDDQSTTITPTDDPKEIISRGKIADAIRSLQEKASETNSFESRRLSEPITISIPVSTLDDSEVVENSGLLLKQTKEPSTLEKLHLSKQFNDDANQFSTSYSKLLYGTNYSGTENNKKISDGLNKDTKSGVHVQISSWNRNSSTKDNEFKRHSIAVDDAKYMDSNNKETFEIPSIKDKIACFKNQFDLKSNSNEKFILPSSSTNLTNDKNKQTTDNDVDSNTNERKQKKVEFCKTEVHFAAEPGRFNIVETDGKPPSSNMFRRRRRTIAETPARSNLPEIRFGDSQYEKELLTCCEVNGLDAESSSPPKAPSPVYRLSPQFLDNDKEEDCIMTQGNALIPIETDDNEKDDFNIKFNETNIQDNEDKPRSILKHNIQKQQNIHVENIKTNFDDYDDDDNIINDSSNVCLKSIAPNSKPVPWKSTVRLQQNTSISEDSESELQKLLKTLRPVPVKPNAVVTSYNSCGGTASTGESSAIAADNGLAVRISSAMNLPDQRRASWSVAERVRHVEDPKNKGFSTKVNFGSGETTVVTPELRSSPVRDLLSTGWISDSVNVNEPSPAKKIQHVTTSNVVPTYVGSTNKVKSVETLVSTRSGHPKITSISLRYTDDVNSETDKNIEKSQHVSRNDTNKTSVFKTHTENLHNTKIFKNESNSSVVTRYSPIDNISVNSKLLSPSARQELHESENKLKSSLNQLNFPHSEAIYEEIHDGRSKSKVSPQVMIPNRKTQSPSSDSVFLERSSKHHTLYNQVNARNRSMSPVPFPTRPVASIPDYANTRQIHLPQKQTVPAPLASESSVWSSISVSKTKKREIMKKDDNKKKLPHDSLAQKDPIKTHKKERRLSTSSSGRDGWLNTPKENAKQRSNYSQVKRQSNVEIKKDKRLVSNASNATYKSEKSATRQGSESPIYQNREVYSKKQEKDPFESLETESAILEELTRAADQILLAVNGYTDEESIKASSDDEYRRKNGKEKFITKPLSTISEMPARKKTTTTAVLKKENFSKTSGSPAQSSVGANSRTRLCKTSSNSSVEGNVEAKNLLTEERSKRRAARLLQRASSRELLLQNTGASSSEDVASGTETTPQRSKQRVVRRTAKQYSSRTTTSHQNSTLASTSRTKDRVQRTGGSTVDEKEHVGHSRRRADEKSKTNRVSTTSGSGRTSMPPAGAIRCDRSSRLIEQRPPERPRAGGGGRGGGGGCSGGGGGVGRTRNQHALSKKKCTSGASHRENISQTIK